MQLPPESYYKFPKYAKWPSYPPFYAMTAYRHGSCSPKAGLEARGAGFRNSEEFEPESEFSERLEPEP